MGVNIQKEAQRTFKRLIDDAIESVSNGDLFDETPNLCPRQFLADPSNGAQIKEGDLIYLELNGNSIIGTSGIEKVLQVETPLDEVVQYMKTKGGIVEAIVSKVNLLSGTLGVEPC